MTSMAAALAASLPAAPIVKQNNDSTPQAVKVPQRLEGVVDVDASREVESVQLSSLVVLKILKHSTDDLPAPPSTTLQQDRNPPPTTELSSKTDALGILLGLDLDGVLEVEDSFALPPGETSFSPSSYSGKLLSHLREVSTPDSAVGIYIATHNGGYVSRAAIDLLRSVENVTKRGKGVIVVRDLSVAENGGEAGFKAWRLTDGARDAAKSGRWDAASLAENKLTSANFMSPLPIAISSPALLSALLSSLSTPSSSSAASSSSSSSSSTLLPPPVSLPKTFSALSDPLPKSLPGYLHNTLDALTLHNSESNNVAFLQRSLVREKQRHDAIVKEREEENVRRKKQGLAELPSVAEWRGGGKEPNRLEWVVLGGVVDGLAKNMGVEASKGLVRAYL